MQDQGAGQYGPPAPQGMPPPQPIIQMIPAPPPKPKQELIDAAWNFVPDWLKRGMEDNDRKKNDWLRMENIFLNRLPLDWWNYPQDIVLDRYWDIESRSDANLSQGGEPSFFNSQEDSWRSQLCLSIASLVFSFADTAFSAIFSTDEWLTVKPMSGLTQPNVEDNAFSTSDKLRVELMQALEETKSKSAIYQLLLFCAIYGRAFAKVTWDEQSVPTYYYKVAFLPHPQTGQLMPMGEPELVEQNEIVRAAPSIEAIKPDCIIQDVASTSIDTQSWTGIAHVGVITWHECVAAFESGRFNINKKEFFDLFPDADSVASTGPISTVASDKDRRNPLYDSKVLGRLKFYEYQGKIPLPSGERVECVYTLLTRNDATDIVDLTDPRACIAVRLRTGSALRCGRRTIVGCQYSEWPDKGIGAAEPHLDMVFVISHLLNLLIDNLRITTNAELSMKNSVESRNPDPTRRPGKVWHVDEHDDVKPIQPPPVDYGACFNGLNYLGQQYEMRTGVSDARRGVSKHEKTAREVSYLEQMANVPVSNRLQMFRENLLNPVLTIALAEIQEFGAAGKQIPIKDSQGIEQYTQLTEEEIRSGRYAVKATLGNQDSTRLARAQTLERVLPTLGQIMPILQQQGALVQFLPLVRSLLEALQVPHPDAIVRAMLPQEIQQQQQQQQMAMQQQMMQQQGQQKAGPSQGGPPPGPPGPPQQQELPFHEPTNPEGQPRDDEDILAMLAQLLSADEEGRSQQL